MKSSVFRLCSYFDSATSYFIGSYWLNGKVRATFKKYMPAHIKARWDPSSDFRFKAKTAEDFALARLVYQKQVELVGMMRRAGLEFLAGTDVGNPYCFPGFSLHDELGLLVQAGLTPM